MRKLFETPKRAIISMTVIFAVVMVVAISGVYGAFSKELDKIKNLQYNSTEQGQVAENEVALQSQPEVAPEADQGAAPEAAPVEPAPEVVPADPVQELETPVEKSGNQIVEQQPAPQQTPSNVNKKIGVKKAKSKALANAGVAKKNVVYTKAHLDYDDGIAIYDVEFYTNDYEYEYEIDAYSGKVREKNIEKNDRVYRPQNNNNNQSSSKPQNNNAQNNNSSSNNNKDRISVDKAKSIAVKHAGYSASKATFKKAKLDYDDGRVVYEIEFYVGNDEYNYEIDAKSGKIIDYDFEKNERYDDDDEWDD